MIDIHAHCIPGIDDGPESLEEAMILIEQAAQQGVTDIIATSHFHLPAYDNEGLQAQQAQLMEAISAAGIPIMIHSGNEAYADEHTRLHLKRGTINTLAGSKYVLLELPEYRLYPSHKEIIYDLQRDGYKVILAHADRYPYLMLDLDQFTSLINTGCYIQVNASFILHNTKDAVRMIEAGYIHFIASDMHHHNERPNLMKTVKATLIEHCGHQLAEKILEENPRHILENIPLEFSAPKPLKKQWFKF